MGVGDKIESNLDRWLYFFKNGKEMEPNNPPPFLDDRVMRKVMSVMRRFSDKEHDRELYRQRLKSARVQQIMDKEAQQTREELRRTKEEHQQTKETLNQTKEAYRHSQEQLSRLMEALRKEGKDEATIRKILGD